MTAAMDTRLDGSPAAIHAVASWLSGTVVPAVDGYVDDAVDARSTALAQWGGTAADEFGATALSLTESTAEVTGIAGTVAAAVTTLGDSLRLTLDDLAHARETAQAGGLSVSGTTITPPAEIDAWLRGRTGPATSETQLTALVVEWEALVEVWNSCVDIVDAALERWQRAVEQMQRVWEEQSAALTSTAGDTLALVGELGAVAVVAWNRSMQSATALSQADELARHLAALNDRGRILTDASHYYDLMDRHAAALREADELAPSRTVSPRGVRIAGGALAVATTGYSIYADIQDGESVAQAVTSNGVGLGASLAAGAATGALIGTAIPVPIVGTVAGAVVGTVVGGVVGIVSSGVIDGLFEGDGVGGAIENGWNDLMETGDAIGDFFGGLF